MKLPVVSGSSKPIIIVLLVALGAALVGLAIALGVLLSDGDDEILDPDQAYEQLDPDMEPYPDPSGTEDEQDGVTKASFTCEAQMTVNLRAERVDLMFANPSRSNQNMVIELLIQGEVIAQSGRIEPGYRITSLPLSRADQLTQGIYNGTLKIYFFDPQTGAQVVDSNFPVVLTVKE